MDAIKNIGIIHAYPNDYLISSLLRTDVKLIIFCPEKTKVSSSDQVDVVFVAPFNNASIKQAVFSYYKKCEFDAILPVNEGTIPVTTEIAYEIGLRSLSLCAAYLSRNKYLSYLHWKKHGLPVPKTVPIYDLDDVDSSSIIFPCVLKLTESMNSQGIFKIESIEQLNDAIWHVKKLLQQDEIIGVDINRNRFAYGESEVKVIVQEYCEGKEFAIDLIYAEGRLYIAGVFEKLNQHGPYFPEHASISPTSLSEIEFDSVKTLAINAISSLGDFPGTAHVEVRFSNGQPKLLEVGLRPGGGYTVNAIEYLTTHNMYQQLLNLYLNMPVETCYDTNKSVLYGGVVYSSSGDLTSVSGVEILKSESSIKEYIILNSVGDYVATMPHSAQPHFCYYLISGNVRHEVLAIHHRINQQIKLQVLEQTSYDSMMQLDEEYIAPIFEKAVSYILDARKNYDKHSVLDDTQAIDERCLSDMPLVGLPTETVLSQAFSKIFKGYCNVSSPNYYGYISPKPLLISILGDMLAAGLNQCPGAWRAGPSATVIEIETLQWLADFIGYDTEPGQLPNGIFTNGGTMANCSALKLARDTILGEKIQEKGLLSALGQIRIYSSVEAHFSIKKSVDLLGFGHDSLFSINTDCHGRVLIDELLIAIERDIALGFKPLCIVGIAGTSATGAIDDLDALARISQQYGMWFHVDAASGGVYANLHQTREQFCGINNADSVTIDPCKWLFVSFGIGCLLVKSGKQLYQSFNAEGNYWEELNEIDLFQMSFSGTRQWRSLGLWMAFKKLGVFGYTALLQNINNNAACLAQKVKASGNLELLMPSHLPICCFRYVNNFDHKTLNSFNAELQQNIVSSGKFYVTLLKWKEINYIRVCINNYDNQKKHIDELFVAVLKICDEMCECLTVME